MDCLQYDKILTVSGDGCFVFCQLHLCSFLFCTTYMPLMLKRFFLFILSLKIKPQCSCPSFQNDIWISVRKKIVMFESLAKMHLIVCSISTQR